MRPPTARSGASFSWATCLPAAWARALRPYEEVRAALSDFHASGKPVIAYLDYATTRDFYLASVANEVVMDPYGELIMPGLSSEPWFFAGAFEKYGIGIQVARVGKYKSYVETFTRTDMSPESREQLQKLLDDIWGTLVADMAKSRGVAPAAVQNNPSTPRGLIKASIALKAHLVDKVEYRDEVIDQLKKETGVTSETDSFKQVQLSYYAKTSLPVPSYSFGAGEVAVVYAEGDIVERGDQSEIGGAKYAREIRRLREDSNVKAIVLRVNSPGGSATASETIQRELRLARKVKPVIVSMGSYAASGGYWISTFSDRIFAEPNTITGSIGVFGIIPNIQKLANDHGVTFDSVKTGKFAGGLLTISRPRTDEELAVFQKGVDWMYGQFITKVAEGRKLSESRVEEIAQGRVWSGIDAKRIGLVDELGGLDAAIKYAGKQVNLGQHFKIVEYPKSRNLSEAIAQMLRSVRPRQPSPLKSGGLMGEVADRRSEAEFAWLRSAGRPKGRLREDTVGDRDPLRSPPRRCPTRS